MREERAKQDLRDAKQYLREDQEMREERAKQDLRDAKEDLRDQEMREERAKQDQERTDMRLYRTKQDQRDEEMRTERAKQDLGDEQVRQTRAAKYTKQKPNGEEDASFAPFCCFPASLFPLAGCDASNPHVFWLSFFISVVAFGIFWQHRRSVCDTGMWSLVTTSSSIVAAYTPSKSRRYQLAIGVVGLCALLVSWSLPTEK
jgi:hypothetical protein